MVIMQKHISERSGGPFYDPSDEVHFKPLGFLPNASDDVKKQLGFPTFT